MASQIVIFETLPVKLLEMIFQYLRESPYSLSSLTLPWFPSRSNPRASLRCHRQDAEPGKPDRGQRASRRYLGFHESQPALEPGERQGQLGGRALYSIHGPKTTVL